MRKAVVIRGSPDSPDSPDSPGSFVKFSVTTLLSAICHAVKTQFLFLNTVKVLFFFF